MTFSEKTSRSPVAIQEAETFAYFELLKPRVMSLVIFTAFVGLVMAPGTMHPVLAFAAVALIAIGAGASGALNMWFDADIDAQMARTQSRPVPSGRVSKRDALGFGVALSVFSVVLLGLLANVTAAVLLAVTIIFYAVVYSMWLKRRTPQNIVIGGAAGAFPPMIGWAAATDSVTIESVALFLVIFLWTPPHFWALSLFTSVRDDYTRAGVPMLPVVSGEQSTRLQVFLYSLALVPVSALPYFLGMTWHVYGGLCLVMAPVFLYLAYGVYVSKTGYEKKLFVFSIFYLFSLFAVMAGEKLILRMIL